MAKQKSMKSLDMKISLTKSKLERAKERCNKLSKELLNLQKEKDDLEARQILNAFKQSRKTLRELMIFLDK